MKGFPKSFNTKKDVMLCLEQWPEKTKSYISAMLANRFAWLIEKQLAEGEAGVTDETHKVTEVRDEAGTVVERYQMAWEEDPTAQLFRLGFTVSEAEGLI
jgi:hypothetical protein